MSFPKNHALLKYAGDIRQFGTISSFSTTHSERQHKRDSKDPAKHVNRANCNATKQMSDYVFHRDLLDDTYYNEDSHIPDNTCPPKSLYTLCSKVSSAPVTIMKLTKTRPDCHDLDALIKVYIEEQFKQQPASERESAWVYDCTKVYAYQQLMVVEDDEDDGYRKSFIRAHPSFFKNARFDYVALKDNGVGQALLFLEITLCGRDETLQLCLLRRFTSMPGRHASGLQTLHVEDDLKIVSLDLILRPIHVVPEFSTMYTAADGSKLYHQYLLNHDVNRYEWSRGVNNRLHIQKGDRVSWEIKGAKRIPPVYKQYDSDGNNQEHGNMKYKGYKDEEEDHEYIP
ncbi:hypothetical protein O0I10_012791 [Lichtheimia ornata]|uniref:Uncharacterized protein n=1 Tax=Lichtheimia ornata TaxID=688661 RepID=A0AAD7USI4_9FUNG|nr:uncharacterized protein O0I10_012791 [Lichtheimia ornata]KAJ8651645.1 hypothetical protein O0I10_012791 [Lichtheimia ornata]